LNTNFQPGTALRRPDKYRPHTQEFKRALVELVMQPGTSVVCIAEHGVNANQIFSWRKLYLDGGLGLRRCRETLRCYHDSAFEPVQVGLLCRVNPQMAKL
jgi:transposase-like protein